MRYHVYNADYMRLVAPPSQAKRGDVFTTTEPVKTSERAACRGAQDVVMPAGTYRIVSRRGFTGGTQEVEAVK